MAQPDNGLLFTCLPYIRLLEDKELDTHLHNYQNEITKIVNNPEFAHLQLKDFSAHDSVQSALKLLVKYTEDVKHVFASLPKMQGLRNDDVLDKYDKVAAVLRKYITVSHRTSALHRTASASSGVYGGTKTKRHTVPKRATSSKRA